MALDEQMTKMLQQDIKDAETRSRKEITQEQIDAGKTAAGLVADMTPFVGGVKGAIEAPEDLEYAKNLMAQGYEEKDLKKMGLGGAFTVLTGLGFIPGAKIATDVTKSAIKSSVKKQTDNLITPKRAEQLEYAKTLPKEERRKYLKEANRPVPKVFHGASNMADDIQEEAKSVYTKAMDDYTETLNQQDVRISDMFLDESKYKKPKLIKKKDGLTAGELREINEKNKKAIETAKQKAQKSHIEPEKLETSSGYITGAKIAGSGDNYYSEYVDFDFVRSEDGKSLKIYDSSDATLVNTIPITNKGVARKDVVTAIDKYNSKLFEESSFSDYEIPLYKTKAQQLEMEGFAPYNKSSFTNSRRRPFEGDKSMFGKSQTGRHLEMRGLKALSTSRDPLVSNSHRFANRVLANIVYADLPKSVKRDLSAEEYSTLADRGNYFYSVGDQSELNERMTRLGSPLSLPKSQHLESEIAIQRPEDLKVKRLSEDTTQVRSDAEPGPTRNTGKLSLSERVREGQQLVNRLFEQQNKVMQYSIVDLENPINAKKVYNEVRSMFKDAQSLAKYTEQYGARGTYDSYIETLYNDRLFVNKLELAARGLPEGEQKKNLVVLADLLDNMPDNTGRQEALARAKTETRGLSDKELLNIMYDRPNLVPSKEYDVPGLGKEVELLDVLPEMGYNDKKRMLFLATQRLNRGGLVQMEKGGVVPMKSMNQQMELFADGGLMDEGGMVDEESGNEVPPGSLREEVRDDIPAQLSEGEFVFPADVVRYIGLQNLMRMRQEAKQGLAQMEAMGQMGNSEEAVMEDDLPFDMYDLDIEDENEYNTRQEFARGGVVYAQEGTFVNPDPQSGVYYQPAAPTTTGVAQAPVAAASAPAAPVSSYTPPQQAFTPVRPPRELTPTFQGVVGFGPEGVEYETVTYVNEAGQTLVLKKNKQTGQLLDMAGNPATIPEGYKLKGEEEEVEVAPVTTETTTVTEQGGGRDDGDVTSGTTMSFGGNLNERGSVDNAIRGTISYRGANYGTGPLGLGGLKDVKGLLGRSLSSGINQMTGGKMGTPMTLNPGESIVIENLIQSRPGVNNNFSLGGVGLELDSDFYNTHVSGKGVVDRGKVAEVARFVSDRYGLGKKDGTIKNITRIDPKTGEVTTVEIPTSSRLAEGSILNASQILDQIELEKSRDERKEKVERAQQFAVGSVERNEAFDDIISDAIAEADADDAAAKARGDMDGYNEVGQYTGYDSDDNPGRDDAGDDGDPGTSSGNQGGGYGGGTDCLTEDMKVNLNGVIDFVTNIKVGDIIDNYKVKEVLHKHMREGYYSINNELKISNDHPVLANGTWTRPEDLVVGDSINGIPVSSLEYVEQLTPTVSIVIDGESFDVHTENNIYTVHGRYREVRQEAA